MCVGVGAVTAMHRASTAGGIVRYAAPHCRPAAARDGCTACMSNPQLRLRSLPASIPRDGRMHGLCFQRLAAAHNGLDGRCLEGAVTNVWPQQQVGVGADDASLHSACSSSSTQDQQQQRQRRSQQQYTVTCGVWAGMAMRAHTAHTHATAAAMQPLQYTAAGLLAASHHQLACWRRCQHVCIVLPGP